MPTSSAVDHAPPDRQQVVAAVRRWVERAVVGLNLCPFAKAVQTKGQVRYVVSKATTAGELLEDLAEELQHLREADPSEIDTTLLIHPFSLARFDDYLWFIDLGEQVLEELGLVGEMQIAHFHPDFQFEGTTPDDITNYSNRSPYPILHLLREASVDRAVAAFPDASEIYNRNIAALRKLGLAGWQALWQEP